MALRTTSGPTLATRSVSVGAVLKASAKVENGAATEAHVTLFAEGTPLPITFEPPSVAIRPKSRTVVEFAWTASLPDGVDAKTLRGKLVLRATDSGALVGETPLDVYVRRE